MRHKRPRLKQPNHTPIEADTHAPAVAPNIGTQSSGAEPENTSIKEADKSPSDVANDNTAPLKPEQATPENPSDSRNGTAQAEAAKDPLASNSRLHTPSRNLPTNTAKGGVHMMTTRFTSHEIEQERYGYGGRNFRERGGLEVLHFSKSE